MNTKPFPNESCPMCGSYLIVTTQCDPSWDDDFDTWFQDGDKVECESCEFESVVSVSDGQAWVTS